MSESHTMDRADLGIRSQFPGLLTGDGEPWHYLDSGATAQKPRVVIDAMARALGEDYATVHRGIYSRSAQMTLGYEAARRRVAAFIGGGEDELVFTRGATEAINLVAYSYPNKGRVLLSQLEHHSNIVPWQLAGWQVDVCPLTEDGRIDLDAAEAMLTPEHEMVAFAHVSNVLGSVLDAPRAAELAHAVGAKLLLDGCQAAPRLPVFVDEIGCDFYAITGHKLYGPSGSGAIYINPDRMAEMRPFLGGGDMIREVTKDGITYNDAPMKFEAGTPGIVQTIGMGVALDYMMNIGMQNIAAHEASLRDYAVSRLSGLNWVQVQGTTPDKAAIFSFTLDGAAHAHDISTILDKKGVAVRAGQHCCGPLMQHLGQTATCRASFGMYNTNAEIDTLIEALELAHDLFA